MPVEDRIAFANNAAGDQRNAVWRTSRRASARRSTRCRAGWARSYRIGDELAQARVLRDVLSERQLQEVMTDFWFNHFNVYIGEGFRPVVHDEL